MNAIAFQIINRLAEILREPDRYAKASGQRTFGFKSEGGHGGQKSFKWREELHPRDADGKFATEENKGQKAEEPENQAQVEEPAETESPEEETTRPTPRKKKVSTEVSDFGDKIEVRKDAARANGPRRARKEDDRPGWARRYEVRQAATSMNKSEVGKWFLYDTKIKDRWGNDKEHGMFDTKEEAEAAIPQVEVNRNHRVFRISDGEWADPAAGKEWLAQMNAHYANPDGVPKPEGERPEKIGEEFAISRVVGDKKRPVVVGGFKTREEASEYMKNNPEEIIEHKFPRYETYAFLDHVERQGPKVRDGNVSVKKDNNDFQKTFNFRGGVFGNWQTNKDGQTSLNHAYDALHDLTSAIGLPPKAAALDGTLAIGFGADGTGGVNSARAHFDPEKNLINLTKMSGAGSLAHEWAHALDWYIGGGNNDLSNPKYNTKMRPEVAAAAKELRNAMNSKTIEEEVKAPETSHDVDEVAQTRKNYPNVPEDQLRIVSPATVGGHLHNLTQGIKEYRAYKAKSNKKMAGEIPADQMKQWNDLTAKIASGDVGEKKYVGMRKTYENVEKLNALHKTLTGRSFHTGDWTNPSVGHRLVGRIDDRLSKQERVREAAQGKKETRRVQSDFMKSASKLDDTRGQDYYSTPHEMFARAFEAYVADKLKGKGIRSDYLVSHKKTENHAYSKFGMSPFPEGEERQRINSAFDNLVATLKQESRSDEKGDHVKLYSMRRHDDRMVYALSPAERIASRIADFLIGPIEKYRKSRETDDEGHWVTIDGRHVFIKDATAGDHAKSMGKLHRVKAEHVQHLMSEAHQFLKSQIDQRESAKAHARRLSRLNAGSIGKIENSYRDWSSVDGFDSIARDVALAHPELGFDPDDTDTPGKVWDLIREGKEEYPSADSKEVAELAAKWLKSSTPKKREVYPEDSLPFSRQARGDEADKYAFREEDHPRDNLGQFTAKHQEAIRKARDTASQKRSAADAAVKALESAEQKWRESDDEDDSGLNAAYDAHEIASEEAENAQSAAEEAEQQARDELEGISDDVRAEIDSAKDEADELSEEHARASKNLERLTKDAESKRARATKLRERANVKLERMESAKAAESAASEKMYASLAKLQAAEKSARAALEIASRDDATDEQVAASNAADALVEKLDKAHDVNDAAYDRSVDAYFAASDAYDTANENAMSAEEVADEAESEVRQAQQELQEIASKWEAAKATAADLERRRLEIDNFRKSIGPALQGLFSPGVQKYSADKGEDRWITIGGSEDGNRKHAGGTAVKIDKEGKIVAGPDALAGKKVDELGSGKRAEEKPVDREPDPQGNEQPMSQQEVAGMIAEKLNKSFEGSGLTARVWAKNGKTRGNQRRNEMNTITATRTNNQTHRFVAEQIAKAMGVEIVDRAKVGKSVEFYTEDFRVIRVY